MGDARLLLKKNSDPSFSSTFSAIFVENSDTPISTLANNKRFYSKRGKFQAKTFFFVFRRKIWHGFATPFSTFVNNKRVLFD